VNVCKQSNASYIVAWASSPATGVWTFSRACSNRPKGGQRTAQGFGPGSGTHKETALKGRPNRID